MLLLLLGSARASAQTPKFDFQKPEEVKESAWKAQAKGGLLLTSGNSQTTTGTMGASAAYKAGWNRFTLDTGIAYVSADVITASDGANGVTDMMISADEITRTRTTTSNSWMGKARYDRFLTENNSAYVSSQFLIDRPAGKELVGGGQVGYSRQLFKTDRHLAVAEIGYDFSYEQSTSDDAVGVPIHSARAFLGEAFKVSSDTGAFVNVEVLTNLNEEKAPAPDYEQPAAFDDTRVLGKTGLTTTLWNNLSFGFSFTVRYDHAPAPLPAFKIPFAAGFFPQAKELDTLTEASLVFTFL
jgi:putative salt-induced outer membrane protein YdiY